MNRTDRLLAIVLELQAKGKQRSEDLAATFEVSKRTIYRDVLALCEAGVPVISTPGQGYTLVEGYFLPPLSFSADEAMMLLLGSDVMADSFDAEYRRAAEAASRKIAGALPKELRQDVQSLRQSIQFVTGDALRAAASRQLLQQLRGAILKHQRVQFHYYAKHHEQPSSEPSVREANPLGLIHVVDTWYLVAHCHLRNDIRNFRLDRIEQLVLLDQTFVRSLDFAIAHERELGDTIVRVLFDNQVARWVREAHFYYKVAEEECPEGLIVTLAVRHEREVVQWLLGWGRHAHVIEPESLRVRLAEEAEAILQMYQPAESLLT